jgi:ATP-dependent exoDNAse (exonuclease V) beta subunit
MLANDSTTIAVEVPVWLAQDDIIALEEEYGIRLHPGATESSITGHIDFLQVRNGAVHILDYKPDEADRSTCRLRTRTFLPYRHQDVRYQMRLVQRKRILRIFSTHASFAYAT